MLVFTVLLVKTNHYKGKDTFDFTTLFSSCTDDKNNLEQLFNVLTKVIRHTVKTSYCCEILFVTSYFTLILHLSLSMNPMGGGPRVVVSTAASHARVWGSFPGLGFERNKNVPSSSTCESQYCGEPP